MPICGDTDAEPDETFTLNLSGATNATISDAAATGTIQNDDGSVTYTWNPTPTNPQAILCAGPLLNSWICPSNWQPVRPSAASANTTDILIFDGIVTPGATVPVLNVPNQILAALHLQNNINAAFEAAGPVTVNMNGDTGSDFSIASGSALTLRNSNAITLSLTAAGTEGNIAGSLVFEGAAHQLTGANPDEIVFQSGSIFTTTTGFTGHPFGSGTNGSVNMGGSSFFGAGLDPFGGAGKTIVSFGLSPMSNQEFSASSAFDSNGRSYGNLTLTGSGQAYSGSGSGLFTVFGNFVLDSNSTLTLSGTAGGDMVVNGNFTDNNATLTAFQGNGRAVQFQGGSATQTSSRTASSAKYFLTSILQDRGSVKLLTGIGITGQLQFGGVAGSAVDVLELNAEDVSLGGTLALCRMVSRI